MIKKLTHIILIIISISILTSCYSIRGKIHRIKNIQREKEEIRKIKNDTVNLYRVQITVIDPHIDEFKKLDIEKVFKNISYDQISEYLRTNYRITLKTEKFSESLINNSYENVCEYSNEHGNMGHAYNCSIELGDSIQNRIGLEILISWANKRLLCAYSIDMDRRFTIEISEKDMVFLTSKEIYDLIINPVD